MIWNILAFFLSLILAYHSSNNIKEDWNANYEDNKVWFFEDGGIASKICWGTKILEDTAKTIALVLVCVGYVSNQLNTKPICDMLEGFEKGFESGSDLKEKCLKIVENSYTPEEKKSDIKKDSSINQTSKQTSKSSDNCGDCISLDTKTSMVSYTDNMVV